jgi:hypothetical protein
MDMSFTSRSNIGSLFAARSGTTSADGSSFSISAVRSALRAATAATAADAARSFSPLRRRAIARNSPVGSGSSRRRAASGIHSWKREEPGNPMNFSGATPTTVTGTPFTTSVDPMTPGLFANSCSHAMWPITAIAEVAGSSAPTAGRPTPSTGLTRSTGKYVSVTNVTRASSPRCSTFPPRPSVVVASVQPATASNTPVSLRYSRNSSSANVRYIRCPTPPSRLPRMRTSPSSRTTPGGGCIA